MKTTTNTSRPERAILNALVCGTQTDAYVTDVCARYGIDDAAREEAISTLLDGGLIEATVIDAQHIGQGFVAALRLAT